ncbi:MAG: PEP-CTERM sorting domain-containing protein [Gemmatimonadaceae bacterium]|nr:PEP-CTERM sorting domain-containing protein [Gemmatimonadaceae bacterium]
MRSRSARPPPRSPRRRSTSSPPTARLLSPVLTASGGAFSISATHRYNFEQSLFGSPCFDGGVVFASINGGAFAALAPSSGKGYDGPISTNFDNPLGGQQAFCGEQLSNVISTWSGTLAAGTTIQLALDGAWDNSFAEASPNWNIRSLTISGFGGNQNVIPEPSTYALMATGLAGLAGFARRRRGATR